MRFFLYCSYDGSAYHGWQVQPNGISVQEVLQQRLSQLLATKVEVTGAGRTDAGVHARMMVAHFDCSIPSQWEGNSETGIANSHLTLPHEEAAYGEWITFRLARMLPSDIAVSKVLPVCPTAHARFDALSRTYRYYITHRHDPFLRHYTCFMHQQLDYNLMNEACQQLFRYTDFTSFSKLHTDVKTNNCTIMEAHWTSCGEREWVFTIRANRFLRNMVRAIVGTLVDVGLGKLTVEDFCRIIEGKDRCQAGMSMPGHALFLEEIIYPDHLFLHDE